MMRARALLAAVCALAIAACGGPQGAPAPAPSSPAQPLAAHAPAPDPPSPAPIRYIIGGDSRQDDAQVVIWAFHEAKARGAAALVYLGDMELRPALDDHFRAELGALAPVRFLPVLGNHDTARRKHAAEAPREDRERAVHAFAARFIDGTSAGVNSAFSDKLVYSVDLPGGVHFVALDNVSQPGFGADQLAWLRADLGRAHATASVKHIVVGMHKAFAGGGITRHAMEEDGPAAVADSDAALSLCVEGHVEMIVASHFHAFAEYAQRGIRSFISGGMGAPLDTSRGKEAAFHHVLAVTVPPEGPLAVDVVRFPGTPVFATEDEP